MLVKLEGFEAAMAKSGGGSRRFEVCVRFAPKLIVPEALETVSILRMPGLTDKAARQEAAQEQAEMMIR